MRKLILGWIAGVAVFETADRSGFVEPERTHGLWLEFRRAR